MYKGHYIPQPTKTSLNINQLRLVDWDHPNFNVRTSQKTNKQTKSNKNHRPDHPVIIIYIYIHLGIM
jgi:hypothetical protein